VQTGVNPPSSVPPTNGGSNANVPITQRAATSATPPSTPSPPIENTNNANNSADGKTEISHDINFSNNNNNKVNVPATSSGQTATTSIVGRAVQQHLKQASGEEGGMEGSFVGRPRGNANCPAPNYTDPEYRIKVKGAGPYIRAVRPIFQLFLGERSFPVQGWKLHISAFPPAAELIAQTILPVLTKEGIAHKYISSPVNLNNLPSSQKGKFITVYPISVKDTLEIIKMLDPILAQYERKGPPINNDLRVGNSGMLFARYGSFIAKHVVTLEGELIEDDRTKHKPDWVPELGSDLEDIFPCYARVSDYISKLKGKNSNQ